MFTKKKIKVYLDLCWPPLADLVQHHLYFIGQLVVICNCKAINKLRQNFVLTFYQEKKLNPKAKALAN
jgi:hypothetical protein